MTFFFRRSPPFAPSRVCATLCIFGAAIGWASAQPTQPRNALQAADPDRPAVVRPLVLPPTTPTDTPALPGDIAAAREVWQRANQRVAEFPRGHADLLRWESRHAPADTSTIAQPTAQLDFAQALRLSLRHRPELFTHADMNALARAQVQVQYAAHVRELRRAWAEAIATRQRERLLGDVLDATRTGSELGRRMVAAGNWSQARLLREQLIEANAWQDSANARGDALAAQERLARLLGEWDAQAVAQLGERLPTALPELPAQVGERLPAALPELPAQPSLGEGVSDATLEATALRSHPMLAQARLLAERDINALPPSRRQAWNEAVDTALQAQSATTAPHIDNLSLLRDASLASTVAAEAQLLQWAVERRSQAREAWTTLQLRHASAVHAQNVVAKLQTAIEQETLLRTNGMLQSTWDLLASARERMAALDAAVQARRDYWLAHADWQALK
ncbi:hypothetical protein [Hydrogenophaga sp.]|uniref:hypothetical protein n=1 Tax=Hydrogenophaga sp. TaxID=1904254 RepID=UPI00271991D9|nr:hypothetical protein [Hydrogenophaga sp.]MDO9437616.1 hypothetical protein [Hydrogenophaga sp.]